MKTIINIDWQEVEELMAQGDYTIRTQIRDAYEKMRKISADDFARREDQKRLDHERDLKKLKPYTKVHYIGQSPDFVGCSGTKVKDGHQKMQVMMLRNKTTKPELWMIPYRNLTSTAPTTEELKDQIRGSKVIGKITELLTR